MLDIRVTSLTYRLWSLDSGHSIAEDCPPWEGALGSFDCRLAGLELTARARSVYRTIGSARRDLAPSLRTWEWWSDIRYHAPFEFRLVSATIVNGAGTERVVKSGRTYVAVKRGVFHSYPEPPDPEMSIGPVTELLWFRVRKINYGEAETMATGYFCVTYLEWIFDGQEGIKDQLSISQNVWSTLRRLVGEPKADLRETRKVERGPSAPRSSEDVGWVKVVVRQLAYQVARWESGLSLRHLTLADFPKL